MITHQPFHGSLEYLRYCKVMMLFEDLSKRLLEVLGYASHKSNRER